jgi:hypothetical protein
MTIKNLKKQTHGTKIGKTEPIAICKLASGNDGTNNKKLSIRSISK